MLRHHDGVEHAATLMLSPGADHWCQLGAGRSPALPRQAPSTVVLTSSAREQVSGLLDLRDGAPIDLYATPAVFEYLTQGLPLLPVLQQFCGVHWHLIPVAGERREAEFMIDDWPTLSFTALAPASATGGERVALAVRDEISGARLFFGQGAHLDGVACDWMSTADCVVIDGVHDRDCIERLADLPATRKVLTHANGFDGAWLARQGVEWVDQALEIEL